MAPIAPAENNVLISGGAGEAGVHAIVAATSAAMVVTEMVKMTMLVTTFVYLLFLLCLFTCMAVS